MAASATFALKAGVWFRRGRLLMVSPDSRGTACPPSGRNSTYRPVQISGTGSLCTIFSKIVGDIRSRQNSNEHIVIGSKSRNRRRKAKYNHNCNSDKLFHLGSPFQAGAQNRYETPIYGL